MKKLFTLLALVLALTANAQTKRISQLTSTNAIGTNDLFEISARVGSSWATRSINWSNLNRYIAGGGGGLTVGQLATTNYIPRVLVSDATPQDPYRWLNLTNGLLRFPSWSSDRIVGSLTPGIHFHSITNGTDQFSIDVQQDHAAAGKSEARMIALWDMAIVPGYNSGMQLGASTDNYNQTIYAQYANRMGWSHLFALRGNTNGNIGSFAFQGRRISTSTNLNELYLFATEPTWNSYPTPGFSDAGLLLGKFAIGGSYFYSTLAAPLLWATNRVLVGSGTQFYTTPGGVELTSGYSDGFMVGGDLGADSRTTGASKYFWLTMTPKTHTDPRINLLSAANDASTTATLYIGGGSGAVASMNRVKIYAGADSTATGAGSLGIDVSSGLVTTTNLLAPQYDFTTNVGTMNPDFALGSTWIVTNAAFVLLAPKNVDTTRDQITVFNVTNSTAAAVAITAPANVFARGVWYVTNVTSITLRHHGPYFTNATADPIF